MVQKTRAWWATQTWRTSLPATPRKMYIVPLFDGSGMTRAGVLRILRKLGKADMLDHTWTVEINPTLAQAAAVAARNDTLDPDDEPSVTTAAADVWETAATDATRLAEILNRIASEALVIVVAGSPCQQLTTLANGGVQGVCGRDSRHVIAFFSTLHMIRNLRQDVTILPLLENAGSMRMLHLGFLCHAMGIPCDPTHAPVIDTGTWGGGAQEAIPPIHSPVRGARRVAN